MSDYQKALKIQELREQRVDLMWEYITTVLDGPSNDQYIDVREKVKELDKQIKELQNG